MTMAMVSPSGREVSPAEQLCRSSRLDPPRFRLVAADAGVTAAIVRRQAEVLAAYDEQCQREGVVDFAELLLRSYELLARNEILRQHYQRRFRHILVDEFQDTNRLQYRWLKLFAGPETRLFAVGDDDQSIYGFRGANVGNLAEFEKNLDHLMTVFPNINIFGYTLLPGSEFFEKRDEYRLVTLPVAILAGGLATRLKPISEKIPKSRRAC